MVKRFRTKPVEIEAMQFNPSIQAYLDMKDWTEDNFRFRIEEAPMVEILPDHLVYGADKVVFEVYDKLHDTWIKVIYGQWIVRGAKGEYYPCDDETFHWKYEEVVPSNVGKTVEQFEAVG